MFRAAVILLFSAIPALAEAFDAERFLAALRAVETGNLVRDGAHGERGPWQVTSAIWSMHMPDRSFAEARQEDAARICALRHVALLRGQLRAAGCDDNAFNLALAWNAGLGRTLASRAPLSSYDHALRVSNLYESGRSPEDVERPELKTSETRAVIFAIR